MSGFISAGGAGLTLLWTNPNPSSSFSPQTITLNTSGYKYIAIKCCFDNTYGVSETVSSTCIVPTPSVLSTQGISPVVCALSTATRLATRNITVTTTAITFTTGFLDVTGGSGDTYCIPIKIYGVNKELI